LSSARKSQSNGMWSNPVRLIDPLAVKILFVGRLYKRDFNVRV